MPMWQVRFNSPEGVAALQLFVDLMKYQPADVANFNSVEQGACYLEGRCLTNIEWTGYVQLAESSKTSKVVGQTGWTIPPSKTRHASQLGSFMMGIASGSQHQPAALRFLQWFTSDATQREFASRGGIPVRAAILDDPALQQRYPWLPTIHRALDSAVARPRTPAWSKVEEILGQHLHAAVLGQATPQAALDAAAAEATAYLKTQGYGK